MPIVCPRCTLISPDGAEYCDCGYALTSDRAENAAAFAESRKRAVGRFASGTGVLVAGIAASIAGMAGGHPYIAWGWLLGGGALAGHSLSRLVSLHKAKRELLRQGSL
jgi:hypothetical protein